MEIAPEVLDRFGIPRMTSLSYIDDLTGLPNRRFLRRVLDRLIESRGPFSVLFLDLDNFKQVNDSAGHEEGDRILRKLASLLSDSLRRRDLVARYGGDEFVIILAGGERDESILVAEKVIVSVDSELGSVWGVSASIGIACFPEHASVASDLISMSDNAMYSAKASGRASWRIAAPEGSSVFWHEDVFMARNREIDLAVNLLDDAEGNSLVLVTGETGAGKTSFLGVITERIGHRRVLRIEGRPELTGIPWAALAAAIRKHVSDFPEVKLQGMWSNLLGRLMPDVFGESNLNDSIMDSFALLDAFSRLLQGWTPLLCIIDNMQWLDRETLSMLAYALQTGVVSGLSVCAAATEDNASESGTALELLREIPSVREVRLEKLSAFQTAELIKGRLGVASDVEEFADMVYRFSGGNPLFACEYVRTMLNAGLLKVEDRRLMPFSSPSAVPDRIKGIVAKKMKSLNPETRRLLQQASVARKEPLELDLLAEMSGCTQGEILSAMDEGARQGILRTGTDDTMSFYFTNEAFRDEVYGSAGITSIRKYHLLVAGKRKTQGDHLNAGYHLSMSGRTLEALEVYREGAGQCLRSGLPAAAVACLEEAERLSRSFTEPQLPAERLADLKYDLLNAYRSAGNWRKARELALQYADLAEELGSSFKALSNRIMAADCLRMVGEYDQALKELSRLEPEVDGRVLVDCLIRTADSLGRTGRPDLALIKLELADEELAKMKDPDIDMRVDLLHQKLILSIATEDFSSAAPLSEQLIEITRNNPSYPWWYFYDIAETALLSGRPVSSARFFSEGIERSEHLAALHGTLVLKAEMAEALFHSLEMEGAAAVLDQVEELARKFSEVKVIDDSSLIRVELAMESGQLGVARNRMNDLLCRRPEDLSAAVVNSFLLEAEKDFKGSLEEIRRALELLHGRSMSSIIDTSVLTTVDEMRLQESWTGALVNGSDWEDEARRMITGSNDRAAFRASGLLAGWLHDRGRTDEAEDIMSETLGNPDWQEMRLFRYRNLIVRSAWDIDSAEEAHALMQMGRF